MPGRAAARPAPRHGPRLESQRHQSGCQSYIDYSTADPSYPGVANDLALMGLLHVAARGLGTRTTHDPIPIRGLDRITLAVQVRGPAGHSSVRLAGGRTTSQGNGLYALSHAPRLAFKSRIRALIRVRPGWARPGPVQ